MAASSPRRRRGCRWAEEDAIDPEHEARLAALLAADPCRLPLLKTVAALGLPDAWIGAGTPRDAAWDHLHGRPPAPPAGDVDVVFFDPAVPCPAADRAIEARLRAAHPGPAWSVTNQARMHARNGDAPYRDTADAMRHWPETATAVAARWDGRGIVLLAPFGLGDLWSGLLRPGPRFTGEKHAIFAARVATKRWRARWPRLVMAPG